jgi:nicotinamidase-related amidase
MNLTALLVIDVQESFRHRPYFRTDDLLPFFERLNELIRGAERNRWPIAQILHTEPTGPFSEASGLVRPMAEVAFTPTVVIKKQRHSALVQTSLKAWLDSNEIDRLVIGGIRTEQCCETTTRHASDLGYAVDFVTEATLTFPMIHPNGRAFTSEQIRERTELVLADRFARIQTVRGVLDP